MYNDIGVCHFELGKAEQALSNFSQALTRGPHSAPRPHSRPHGVPCPVLPTDGLCSHRAHAYTCQALSLHDKHAPSYSNRANCYKNLRRFKDADADYSKAIEIDDRNPKAAALATEPPFPPSREDAPPTDCPCL